ncbi:MAG: hypothetical protein R3278_08605 [Lysobacter spongiicola]|nr:hypothetical protein [Lysobacter spongiicola]
MSAHPSRTLTGVVAPMVTWALHLVVVYSLAGIGCRQGWHLSVFGGLSTLTWVLLAVTVAALLPVAWLAANAWRDARSASAEQATAARRQRFMGRVSLVLAVLSIIAIIFTATPIFMLPSCS